MTDREPFLSTCLSCSLLLHACTQFEPASDVLDDQTSYVTSADAAPSAAPDAAWACLDQPASATAVPLRASVNLTLSAIDIGSRAAPEGLHARACHRLDVLCEAAVSEAALEASGGPLRLSLPRGFSGFIELTSASSVPTLFFLNQPLNTDAVESLFLVSSSGLRALLTTAGSRLEPEHGHILVRAFDCEGAAASGVEISSGAGGVAFSFESGLPRVGSNVTLTEGLAGYVNVRPGLVFLHGRELAGGRVAGETSVIVRGDWLTYADVEPLPR
jgi:hypothetical protein